MESTSLFYFSKTWKLLTPEELLEKKGIKRIVTIDKRIVTIEADEDMLKRLSQTDIPFFAQKNADGYKVLCDERDEERVKEAMSDRSEQTRVKAQEFDKSGPAARRTTPHRKVR